MIAINDKTKCCGCTACMNACPKKCIKMKSDSEGFLYPEVDKSICVQCGLCEKVCPIDKPTSKEEKTEAYIVRNKNEDIVRDSTSGGAFSAMAAYFFEHGAVVYGTGYDEQMNVVCKMATNMAEIQEMRGSKFVQSRLDTTFSEIKKMLYNTEVLFTGTPCQVAGLISYLGGKPDNLFCVDFVCRGVPSPQLWKNYVEMMEKKYKSKIVGARFRNKTYGYHSSTMKIDFENGKTYYGSGRVDPMMKAFVNELASRPSCSDCAFKGIEHLSDITMFDCKEFRTITNKADDDKGYTSLFIHSEKGKVVFEKIKENMEVFDADIDALVSKNGIMVCNSAKPNPKRDEFYRLCEKLPIDCAINEISPITKKDILIEKMKGILFKTGMIKIARKMRKEKTIQTEN